MFLLPLVLGFGAGILLFSKIVDFFLASYEFETRYLFLGLVLGTVPLFYKEVKKNGFNKKYYILIIAAAIFAFSLFSINKSWFPKITDPNVFQSMLLGLAVAGSSIIPGVDSAVILSSLGLYELYVSSLAQLNIQVLIPAAFGLALGALGFSYLMHFLIKRCYTVTFSVIFGMFIAIIPNVLTSACTATSAGGAVKAVLLVFLGFLISFYFEDVKGNNERIKKWINIKAL